jgi:pimeloyl-ACP methyl ester carboxylesterase
MSSVFARGLRFNHLVLGTGSPTILALHGLLLDNLSSFFFTIGPELARSNRLVLYDLRGHGGSEQPPSGYTLEDMACDTDALLDVTGCDEPVVLLGHSFGGLIALRFALLFPERVKGIILIEAHTGMSDFGRRLAAILEAPPEEKLELGNRLFRNWITLQKARGGDRDIASTLEKLRRLQSHRRKHSLEVADRLVHRTSLVRDLSAAEQLASADLADITCPVLALYGEQSDLLLEGERLSRSMPDCDLMIIEDCAHGVLWQDKFITVGAIRDWLGRL